MTLIIDKSDFFFDWQQAFRAGAQLAGGKGWNLGRLYAYGFPVPPGGVLSATTYGSFMEENNLLQLLKAASRQTALDTLIESQHTRALLRKLREAIIGGSIPTPVRDEIEDSLQGIGIAAEPLAVRSSASSEDSAIASFAGVHDSFLNVLGPESLYEAIKRCYASLWSSGAVSYRRRKGIKDQDLQAAVIIMRMVDAKAAGVAFSCDPRTGRRDEMLISANYGLGETVASGIADPDEYRVAMQSFLPRIVNRKIGRKESISVARPGGGTEILQKGLPDYTRFIDTDAAPSDQAIPDREILTLGILIERVHAALGQGEHPQDVEWLFDGKKFYLVQARPVTSLPRYTYEPLKHQSEVWSNANLRDAVPMVLSTLTWDTFRGSIRTMFQAHLRAVEYPFLPGIEHMRRFHGRAYLNVSVQQWENFDAFGTTPSEYKAIAGGHQPDALNFPEVDTSRRRRKLLRRILLALSVAAAVKKSASRFRRTGAVASRFISMDLKGMSDAGILLAISELRQTFEKTMPTIMLLFSFFGLAFQTLMKALEGTFPYRSQSIANSLLFGCGKITSAEHGYELQGLAAVAREDKEAQEFLFHHFNPRSWESQIPEHSAFKNRLRNFLSKYGHRTVYEAELMNPRWREDPTYLFEFVKGAMDASNKSGTAALRRIESKKKAWTEVQTKIPLLHRAIINILVRLACNAAQCRERGKSEMVRMAEPVRRIALEMGSRFTQRGIIGDPADIFHCNWIEIASILHGSWDGKGLNDLILERKLQRAKFEKSRPPDLIVDDSPQIASPARILSGKIIRGLGVASGIASGTVRLIRTPIEGTGIREGEILVAPSTDPAWTPLFLRASAVVTETGGFASHGAIVAREYGIPAVVNIPGIMEMLQEGRQITVDGDRGEVILKSPE